jgi:NAD(P)-dependent dehydrogenase (short-subunit alcohol dehydrogenase family)
MNNKVALITGAAGGMGRVTAERFVRDGYDLVLCDIDQDSVDELANTLRSVSPALKTWAFACDVASEQSTASIATRLRKEGVSLDVLALLAGVVHDATPITEMPVEMWDRVHGANLRGVFLCARAWVPLLKEQSGASIVTIASWWGEAGHAYFSAYCTSKAAVISLTQVLAAELAPKGIRANTIAPGNIDTGMHRAALQAEADERGFTFDEMKNIEWAKIPLGIAGSPSSISDAIAFLASPSASYITGATLDVNGGVMFN